MLEKLLFRTWLEKRDFVLLLNQSPEPLKTLGPNFARIVIAARANHYRERPNLRSSISVPFLWFTLESFHFLSYDPDTAGN